MIDFTKLSTDELLEIWDAANRFEWHPILGEKPEGFDELPEMKNAWWQFWIKETKADYTGPIFAVVDSLFPEERRKESKMDNFEKFYSLFTNAPLSAGMKATPILRHFKSTMGDKETKTRN